MEQCPICHSPINVTDAQKEELRLRGVYTWLNDPVLTNQGLAGEDYKGLIEVNWQHIKEIQTARIQQENSTGVVDKTTFSEISANIGISKEHINELRISTEKILNILNAQSEETINLHRYFNYCRDGVYQGTWEYGIKLDDKTEWTDVDRTTGLPSLPSEITSIRAIHIEELRYQIPVTDIEEEPQWHGFVIEPDSLILNARCPTIPYFDLWTYLEGLENKPVVTDIYSEDSSIANVVEYYQGRYHVIPISIGRTNAYADYTVPETGEMFHATSEITVMESVNFEGLVTGNINRGDGSRNYYPLPPISDFNVSGSSASGCDGTSLNWNTNYPESLFTGSWENSFNIENVNYEIYPGEFVYPIGGFTPPSLPEPGATPGTPGGTYKVSFGFGIYPGDIGDGYGLVIGGSAIEEGTYYWVYNDPGYPLMPYWACYCSGTITGSYDAVISKYP